jgi:hypothetical protein
MTCRCLFVGEPVELTVQIVRVRLVANQQPPKLVDQAQPGCLTLSS